MAVVVTVAMPVVVTVVGIDAAAQQGTQQQGAAHQGQSFHHLQLLKQCHNGRGKTVCHIPVRQHLSARQKIYPEKSTLTGRLTEDSDYSVCRWQQIMLKAQCVGRCTAITGNTAGRKPGRNELRHLSTPETRFTSSPHLLPLYAEAINSHWKK